MNCHFDAHGDEIAFYLDGDLQFDSSDEAIYHEALALPPLCLASKSASTDGMRVLICGGGDGLALRETLRFPGVAAVDLVDYSAEVLELGCTVFARLNDDAFADARATVHIGDAWKFIVHTQPAAYDVVLCDFSVPRRSGDTRVFTQEWYKQVARILKPGGFVGINGVSPQSTPAAFWCLNKTVRSAGLSPLPFRVCIPSFRDQGYGAWGFLVATHHPLQANDLLELSACPVPTRGIDLTGLTAAATFDSCERSLEISVAVHTVANDTLLPLLLNPTPPVATATSATDAGTTLPPLDVLLRAIPTLHPYHTREMVESVAEHVIGTVRGVDLRRLIDALLARAAELSDDLRTALRRLRAEMERFDREYLTAGAFQIGRFGEWAQRLLVALALLLTIANVVAPDNAFGKGSHGLGHASVSRGYGSEGGSFGRSGEGSFGRGPSGYAAARSRSVEGGSFKTTSRMPDSPLTGTGFRGGYQHGQPIDIFGTSYRSRTFRYRPAYYFHGPYGGYDGGGAVTPADAPAPQDQNTRFVADDDMLVLDNGDVVITLSDTAYLLVSRGHVSLMNNGSPDPLVALYPDPRLFANITARLHDQKIAAQHEVGLRRDWLSWVSWTAAMFSSVKSDEDEVRSLEDLERRLDTAANRVAAPTNIGLPPDLPLAQAQNAVELFVDGGLLNDGRVALIADDGTYLFTDGKTLTNGKTNASTACSPLLASTLSSVMSKLQTELAADQASLQHDLDTLTQDRRSLMSDLSSYTSLQAQYGGDYDVDYGTDEISASDAIARTQADLTDNQNDTASTTSQLQQTGTQIAQISAAIARFAK